MQNTHRIEQFAKLVRHATRSTNKMLAGSRVCVVGNDTDELEQILSDFGAIIGEAPYDFVFLDEDNTAVGDNAYFAEPRLLNELFQDARGLPTVLVTLGDSEQLVARLQELTGAVPVKKQRAEIVELEHPDTKHRIAIAVDAGEQTPAEERIEWALRGMPATRGLLAKHAAILRGKRVSVSLLLEPKTAALVLGLHQAGVAATVFAPGHETDPTVARALADKGVRVLAPQAGNDDFASGHPEADALRAQGALADAIEYLVDDGSHLIRLAHTEQRGALNTLRAAAEETTSGVRPLIEMQSEHELRVPVIAVNNARTKTLFDNRVGTGESCMMAIGEVVSLAGKNCVIFGYGPVGQGTARAAAAFGCRVSIIETDPVAALQAVTDGYWLGGLETADIVISATGVWHTITEVHRDAVPDQTVFAVAGGIDHEISEFDGWFTNDDEYFVRNDGKVARVLAQGAGVNYTAGEGNPLEVMDLSFATQVASLVDLIEHPDREPGVYEIPREVETEIARAALVARGIKMEPVMPLHRPGGASQHWTTHRFRRSQSD